MPIRFFRFFLLPALLISCRSPASRTEPESVSPETRPSAPPPQLSSRNSWILQPTSQPNRYRSSTISVVAMNQGAVSLQDSTLLTASFTVSISRDTKGASYSATLESLSLTAGNRTLQEPAFTLPSPFSFTGRLEASQLSLNTPLDCSNQTSSILPVIRRSLVVVPLQLQRGQIWTDSTSSMACSGSIPVTLTALQSYRVIGETNTGAYSGILLERLDKTTSTGEGVDGQHRVQLRSEGSGQTQLLIDPVIGVLLEATGKNTTIATVISSGRSQRFTQTSREHVTREN